MGQTTTISPLYQSAVEQLVGKTITDGEQAITVESPEQALDIIAKTVRECFEDGSNDGDTRARADYAVVMAADKLGVTL